MDKLKVEIVDRQREVKVPTGIRMLVRRCCMAVLKLEEFEGSAEVCVKFVDDNEIAQLNAKLRGVDASTDVLSFPAADPGKWEQNPETGAYLLGDIAISMEHAARQAKTYGHSLQREVGYLTAHSMLHLLGHDHEGENNLATIRMREKEETVMNQLGYPRSGSYVLDE